MRRLAAFWLALCAVPAAPLWLACGAGDAQQCAMACAHAPGEAVCCPLDAPQPGQPIVKSCAPDHRVALHRASYAVVFAAARLTPPGRGERVAVLENASPARPERRSPEHVPLLLS